MGELTAPREFSPGEDICTLKPFIELLSREFKDVACESCYERVPNLKSCKACLDVKYCGKACQKMNWKDHRRECQKLKKLPLDKGYVDANFIRLLGNTILKIKGKDWNTIKTDILGMEFSFGDIDGSLPSFSRYQRIRYNVIKEYVRRYIGEENMPNDQEFEQISGKVRNSANAMCNCIPPVETIAFIFGQSSFSHECIPNCHMKTGKSIRIIKAGKKIEKSEKLSLNSKLSLENNTDFLEISAYCSCTDCRLPFGESILSKILDEEKAADLIILTQKFINMWGLFRGALSKADTEFLLDDILRRHKGVLGDTNALHLRLLVIKCFEIQSDPLEERRNLLKLEKNIVAAFGEYYPLLTRVYTALGKNLYHSETYVKQFSILKKHQTLVKDFIES